MYRVGIPPDFELLQPFGLPRQHLVGQAFEGLAQHHERLTFGIAGAEVEIAEPPAAPTVPPFSGQDDEVERPGLLDLQPGRAPASGGVGCRQ